MFRSNWPAMGHCPGCRRQENLKKGYCRLCWTEASRRVNRIVAGHDFAEPLAPVLREITCHQLRFAHTGAGAGRPRALPAGASRKPKRPYAAKAPDPLRNMPSLAVGAGQCILADPPRDLKRSVIFAVGWHVLPPLEVPNVYLAWHAAERRAEGQGWSAYTLRHVRKGLVAALAGRTPDEQVPYSELTQLASIKISADRVGAVLEDIGLLLDDRVDSLEATWNRRLEGVAPAIRADVNDWLRRLRDGGPRARPRSQRTIRHYIFHAEPILKQWSQDHDHLREITAEEIRRTLDGLPAGYRRSFAHTALRSLFSFLHKNKRIFRNPTTGYKVRVADTKVFPLSQDDYGQRLQRPRPLPTASRLPSRPSTPSGPTTCATCSWSTSTSANADSPSPAESARLTGSPTRRSSNGSTTAARAGPTPPTLTCSSR